MKGTPPGLCYVNYNTIQIHKSKEHKLHIEVVVMVKIEEDLVAHGRRNVASIRFVLLEVENY